MKTRRARFKLTCRLDGADGATVTISGDAHPMFSVRPARRRREYAMLLEDVAQIIYERVVKAEVAAERRQKNGQ